MFIFLPPEMKDIVHRAHFPRDAEEKLQPHCYHVTSTGLKPPIYTFNHRPPAFHGAVSEELLDHMISNNVLMNGFILVPDNRR